MALVDAPIVLRNGPLVSVGQDITTMNLENLTLILKRRHESVLAALKTRHRGVDTAIRHQRGIEQELACEGARDRKYLFQHQAGSCPVSPSAHQALAGLCMRHEL